MGLGVLWFVFWTFAYVIHPYSSLKVEPTFTIRITAWSVVVPCLVSAVILGGWIAAGFRSKWDYTGVLTSLTRAR